MKKSLRIFLMAVVLLVLAKMAYQKYCASHEGVCPKEERMDYEKDGLPQEGIDW